jgi:hypothetical protein
MTSFDRLATCTESLGADAELVLERVVHRDGVVLSLVVRCGGTLLGRWPAAAGNVQLAAAKLLEPFACPSAEPVAELETQCALHGLRLEANESFVDVHDADGVHLVRYPAPNETVAAAASQALRYLAACGWRDGVILRLCMACGRLLPLAEFRHPGVGVLYACCHRHRRGDDTDGVPEEVLLGR